MFCPGICEKAFMAFIRMKGVTGLVYVPDEDQGPKKYPCRDCHFCQWCSENRCSLCLNRRSCAPGESGEGSPNPGCVVRKKKSTRKP